MTKRINLFEPVKIPKDSELNIIDDIIMFTPRKGKKSKWD